MIQCLFLQKRKTIGNIADENNREDNISVI